MNPVDICNEVTELCEAPFDAAEFPFQFLAAFGNKETVIKRLRGSNANKSDLDGILQPNNIHIKVCEPGETTATLTTLRESPATVKAKAKFALATDGIHIEAEELASGEAVHCAFGELSDHFGFFLPLAGITTVKAIRESSFDIKATGKLNKLYLELLKQNPNWARAERRPDMNHFMARLIFCFFAEDTGIINPSYRFSETIQKMSAADGSDTHTVIETLFRAMNTPTRHDGNLDNRYRDAAGIPGWANNLPYVNGQLFSGNTEVPHFSRTARSFLIHVGSLNWNKINPDIFGSMIQAVADDEERGSLGMHYTSVPNILKVLNPLFLDDLREKLEEAGDNKVKLLNLRKRMARIRVFDPACGSGNFLVIAYKEMRAIEAEINIRREEADRPSEIPLTNFRGIEIRDFPAEIARLALIIAEYQCDVEYRGHREALADFLPLDSDNWIICENALRLDWLSVCPPTGTGVKLVGDDLFQTPLDQAQIDFDNEGGETYICGNPPYKGSQDQSKPQKDDLDTVFSATGLNAGSADYILGWFIKGRSYILSTRSKMALVTTNSVHQGRTVGRFWSYLLSEEIEIFFAKPSFLWKNLAKNNAAVTVSIIGLAKASSDQKLIFDDDTVIRTRFIGPYLVPNQDEIVLERRTPLADVPAMAFGSMPNDGGNLILDAEEVRLLPAEFQGSGHIRDFVGTSELTSGSWRKCLWFPLDDFETDHLPDLVKSRFGAVRDQRAQSTRPTTKALSSVPHRFGEVRQIDGQCTIVIGGVSTETRRYLPAALVRGDVVVSNLAFAIFNAPLWCFSIVTSALHRAWVATVCGKMRIHYRYSNTLGWNTFPVPTLGEDDKIALAKCAEDILLAREEHFPKSIADLYEVKDGESKMPENLRRAHERNDEVLERIYIGRKFKNDTERLEKLFELYTKMTSKAVTSGKARKA